MDLNEGNIFSNSVINSKEEIFNTIFLGKNINIEQIISSGQTSPETGWYDQQQNEWIILLEGEAKIEFDDHKIKHLQKGDYLLIPAHCKHKVTYTSALPKCIWLAVFFE